MPQNTRQHKKLNSRPGSRNAFSESDKIHRSLPQQKLTSEIQMRIIKWDNQKEVKKQLLTEHSINHTSFQGTVLREKEET